VSVTFVSRYDISLLNSNDEHSKNKAMVHCILCPSTPCTKDSSCLSACWRLGRSTTQHTAGVLDVHDTAVSHHYSAHYRKTWCHPQNRKYITWPSSGHMLHAHKIWWLWTCGSWDTHADRQTDMLITVLLFLYWGRVTTNVPNKYYW